MQSEDRAAHVEAILKQGNESILSTQQGTEAPMFSYAIRNHSKLQEMLGKLSTPANVLNRMDDEDPASAQIVRDLRNVVQVCRNTFCHDLNRAQNIPGFLVCLGAAYGPGRLYVGAGLG
jgi:hypothetical protein